MLFDFGVELHFGLPRLRGQDALGLLVLRKSTSVGAEEEMADAVLDARHVGLLDPDAVIAHDLNAAVDGRERDHHAIGPVRTCVPVRRLVHLHLARLVVLVGDLR